MSQAPGDRRPRVAVVADDLIWATRLTEGARRAGADPVAIRRGADVERGLDGVAGVIVDTSARAYDPLDVIRAATRLGLPSMAVAPHEDRLLRRSARDAGAATVHAYRSLFDRGEQVLAAWLARLPGEAEEGT